MLLITLFMFTPWNKRYYNYYSYYNYYYYYSECPLCTGSDPVPGGGDLHLPAGGGRHL